MERELRSNYMTLLDSYTSSMGAFIPSSDIGFSSDAFEERKKSNAQLHSPSSDYCLELFNESDDNNVQLKAVQPSSNTSLHQQNTYLSISSSMELGSAVQPSSNTSLHQQNTYLSISSSMELGSVSSPSAMASATKSRITV